MSMVWSTYSPRFELDGNTCRVCPTVEHSNDEIFVGFVKFVSFTGVKKKNRDMQDIRTLELS
jgi:hypothetical protein